VHRCTDTSTQASLLPLSAPESHWCYAVQAKDSENCVAPDQWGGQCRKTASPPSTSSPPSTVDEDLDPSLLGYDKKQKWTLQNNGHSGIQRPGIRAKQEGPGEAPCFSVTCTPSGAQWGGGAQSLSESQMQKLPALPTPRPGEHIGVTTSSPQAPLKLPPLLFQAGSKNEGFQPLVEALSAIPRPMMSTAMTKSISLFDLLPKQEKLRHYYRYLGSLTTPGCEEKVVWTVFAEPIQLHMDQILAFSEKLYYDNNQKMTDNVRPLQPRGQRPVFRSQAPGRLLPLPLPALLAPTLTCLAAGFLR
uniref:Carbonic anhydrase 4 n=2 Tax=Myotis lucifugus TaxID=59463 RepID=G1Q305_MYOLU